MDQNPTPAPEAPFTEPAPTAPVAPITPQPTVTPQPTATPSNVSKGLAIAALVCGICSLVFCWVPVLGLVLSILGVVLGIVALVKKQSKGMSIAGLICGAFAFIDALVFTLFGAAILAIFGVAADDYSSYEANPIQYCINNPYSSYCNDDVYDYDYDYDYDYGDDDDDWTWTYDDDKESYSWMDDFVDDLFEDNDEYVSSSVKNEFVDLLSDYVTCLNDNGLDIDSKSDLEAIFDGDTSAIAGANLTTTQSSNIIDCSSDLTDSISDLGYDY